MNLYDIYCAVRSQRRDDAIIEAHLLADGYVPVDVSGFDRESAFLPTQFEALSASSNPSNELSRNPCTATGFHTGCPFDKH